MRALCVLHDHVSAGGHLVARLGERGWQVDELLVVPAERYTDPDVSVEFPAPTDYDLLVMLGAPWSACDDELIGRWLVPELAWLRAAAEADVPMLAVCFGAHALTRALGGRVVRSDAPEIGYVTVDSDDPDLVAPGPWFQWHYDRFEPPPGAVPIARNGAATQAYRIGRALAVQFHPEVTPDVVVGWLDNGGEQFVRECDTDPDELLVSVEEHAAEAPARAAALVDAFLAKVVEPVSV